jgi:hypothetical protein
MEVIFWRLAKIEQARSYQRARDPDEASEKSLRISIDRVGRRIFKDLAAARSDIEAEEILYRYQIGSVHPFAETVLPGTGLVGDREPSLERVFLYF